MLIVVSSVLLGVGIGASLGLLGGGGSILTVPALVYVLGRPVAEATGTSLAIVGITALIGAAGHYRAGRVALRAALGFGAASMTGAVVGSLLGKGVDAQLLLLLFALLMITAGLSMLRPRQAVATTNAHSLAWAGRVVAVGFGVGVLTGFFGVGGGFVIVPALTLVLGLPMRTAVGTSLVVIALASAAGLVTHLGAGALNPAITLCFVSGGLAGSLLGARLAGRLPDLTLRRGFATLVFVLAAYLIVRNAGAVTALAVIR